MRYAISLNEQAAIISPQKYLSDGNQSGFFSLVPGFFLCLGRHKDI